MSARTSSQHDRIGALLAAMAEEAGPIPDLLMEQARRIWRSDEIDGAIAPNVGAPGRSSEQ